MQRGCTSILRNGILKQYPPVLLRLATSNGTGANLKVNNKQIARLLNDQQPYGFTQNSNGNSLNVHNEEELRRACVQMIEQCQLMVRKLQLQPTRPNTKSARRRRNPRNQNCTATKISGAPEETSLYNAAEQLKCTSNATAQCGSGETASNAKGIECCIKHTLEDNTHYMTCTGPKLLQDCTVVTPAPVVPTAPPTKPPNNRRGTTRKPVKHPVTTIKREECETMINVNKEHHRTTPTNYGVSLCDNCNKSSESLGMEPYALPAAEVPPKVPGAAKPVRLVRTNNSVGDSAVAVTDLTHTTMQRNNKRIPLRVLDGAFVKSPLQLSDTPLQYQLRAQERATATVGATSPSEQAERAVDTIYQRTMACLAKLGRLPRVLQTPLNLQQAAAREVPRCPKNSIPNLPNKTVQHNPTRMERFLPSASLASPPPKVLNDCNPRKQLYSRPTASQQKTTTAATAKTATVSDVSSKGGTICCYRVPKSGQQVRQLMTTGFNVQARKASADDACKGFQKQELEPKCKPKIGHSPCRPAPPLQDCAIDKEIGPCREELRQKMSTQKQRKKRNAKLEEHNNAFKATDPCTRPKTQMADLGSCRDKENLCNVTLPSPSRLRRPPIPRHLLKRPMPCFEECMSQAKQEETNNRRLSNCERMLQQKRNKTKGEENRPEDPMKQGTNPCVAMKRCQQPDCPVLHLFAPPPRSDADLPPSVLPLPKNMCDQPDPSAVPPWEVQGGDIRGGPHDKQKTCSLHRPTIDSGKTKNTCGPRKPKVVSSAPICGYKENESFVCQTDADMQTPDYPDPICPPFVSPNIRPQRLKHVDVLSQVPCAKKCLTCEERLQVDDYCDPCYKAKQMHEYSGTAYYDLHNYMAGRRRRVAGPANYKRRRPWKDDTADPCK